MKDLIRNRFGKKSERYIDDPKIHRRVYLEKTINFLLRIKPAIKYKMTFRLVLMREKRRVKHKKDIPIHIEIIPVPDKKKQCSCGSCKSVIRYEAKTLIHHQSAVNGVIEQRREVVACDKGCDGEINFGFNADGLFELDNFFLHPNFIGKGIGRMLWHACCQEAKNQGKKEFIIWSDPNAEKF